MFFLALVSLFLLIKKKILLALIFLVLSIGIKFVTIFLLPVFLWVMYQYLKNKEVNWEKVIFLILFLMTGAVLVASLRTNFQPWYLLYILPFAALLSYKTYIVQIVTLITLTALFNYIPFLYTGNWDPPIPTMLNNLNTASGIIAVVLFCIFFYKEGNVERKK
jgi:hypothetical protein